MLKRLYVSAGMVVALAALTYGDTTDTNVWTIDHPHSSIGFTVRHLMVSKVSGEFGEFSGEVTFDGENLEQGSAQLQVQVASIDTDNEKRDNHLRSPDFFDVEKYPTMTFQSRKVIPGDDSTFQLVGDLTIKDVTKEVTFDCELNGIVSDPWGGLRAGFSAETRINRQDFNVEWNTVLDSGGLMVSDEVTINLELQLVKAEG